ncbi:MAG: toxin [Proteobacteria bacterium]|nr:toxin [Pseudomonadota bacterium]
MRYVVIGTSGAGKSTFARLLAAATGGRYVELDRLHWAPGWTERPRSEFSQAVAQATAGPAWVVDGNYSAVRDIVWPRASHVVWLNFSRRIVFSRIVRRTARRALFRQTLWHGNRESIGRAFLSKDSIIWWSISTYGKNRSKYRALRASGAFEHLQWHELRTPAEAAGFVRQAAAAISAR